MARNWRFVSDREERSQVWVIPTDGGEAERSNLGQECSRLGSRWSPKGDSIAFLAAEPKPRPRRRRKRTRTMRRVVDKDDRPERLWVVDAASKKVRRSTG